MIPVDSSQGLFMLTIRPFKNTDPVTVLAIWNANAHVNPSLFSPIQMDTLEAQVFGSFLFERNGFLIAEIDGRPVGFIHSSFAPNESGNSIDPEYGVIYPPVLLPDCPSPDEVGCRLIESLESYLKTKGCKQCLAGGLGKDSPFYTGLYGRTNPFGLFAEDLFTIKLFEDLGYTPYRCVDRFRLALGQYHIPRTQALLETHRQYIVQRTSAWKPRNWWEAYMYRNFLSGEWIAYSRADQAFFPEPVAGVVVHQLYINPLFQPVQYYILAYIGVLENSLRQGIGTVLLGAMINDLQYDSVNPMIMDTIVPQEDERLRHFVEFHAFQKIGEYRSFVKNFVHVPDNESMKETAPVCSDSDHS